MMFINNFQINHMNKEYIRTELNSCLIKDYLDDPEKYSDIADPFPEWFTEQAEEEELLV